MSARESCFGCLLNTRVRKLQNRLFMGSAAVLLFTIAHPAQGQTVDTQVTLSCNDGHSVIFQVDQITLTSLLADVQAINTSGTGTSCTLNAAAIDPSGEAAKWTVYDYNPSGQAIAPRNSPNSMPATTTGTTTTFQFKSGIYTALLTTSDPSLTGDLSAKTLSDMISVSGDAASFMTQHNGGNCVSNAPAAVRFYFRSPSASGPSTGTPPAGFYTQFWWSNPANVPLTSGSQGPDPITADMFNPSEWSDWNGQNGSNPEVTEAFLEATHKVQAIGLSFGGECFFETGVTPTSPSPLNSSPVRSVRTRVRTGGQVKVAYGTARWRRLERPAAFHPNERLRSGER